jgi:hypothetical protein
LPPSAPPASLTPHPEPDRKKSFLLHENSEPTSQF